MEEELFNLCKIKDDDETVSFGVLLHVTLILGQNKVLKICVQELKNMGIRRDDPRLQPILQEMKAIRRLSNAGSEGIEVPIENIQLSFIQFKQYYWLCYNIGVNSSYLQSDLFKHDADIENFPWPIDYSRVWSLLQ